MGGDPEELLSSVQRAIERARTRRESREEVNTRLALLTPRQRQVLDLVVDGSPNKAIGMRLGISKKTVEIHRAKMMEIMKARGIADLVKMLVATENLWKMSQASSECQLSE